MWCGQVLGDLQQAGVDKKSGYVEADVCTREIRSSERRGGKNRRGNQQSLFIMLQRLRGRGELARTRPRGRWGWVRSAELRGRGARGGGHWPDSNRSGWATVALCCQRQGRVRVGGWYDFVGRHRKEENRSGTRRAVQL
jgi:hypothetical protein